jgi:hypothetical protein
VVLNATDAVLVVSDVANGTLVVLDEKAVALGKALLVVLDEAAVVPDEALLVVFDEALVALDDFIKIDAPCAVKVSIEGH